MNEGFLGKHTLGGERAATDDHPVILHHLPLAAGAKAKAIPVGMVMKRLEEGSDPKKAVWAPMEKGDEATLAPVAVVDVPCDPVAANGIPGELSALCVVHGCVKQRLLKLADDSAPSDVTLAKLAENGIFAV